jgi:hypothetical protein
MNSAAIEGWMAFPNPRRFEKYGKQKGWVRKQSLETNPGNEGEKTESGFVEVTEQLEMPF